MNFLPAFSRPILLSGVWSPHNRSTEILTKAELAERSKDNSGKPSEPLQPVWTPRSAPPSPVSERREFRPIGYESPTPQRKNLSSTPTTRAGTPQVAPPWTTTTTPAHEKPAESTSITATGSRPLQNSNSLPTIGSRDGCTTPTHTVRFAPQSRQTTASPTINTLLKSKGEFHQRSNVAIHTNTRFFFGLLY